MAALRRRALARMLGPVLGHPAGDRLLVALDGAAGGALQAVVQAVAQQLPHVAGMVADPGQLLDHGPDAGKGPVVAVEAVRAGALAQGLVDSVELLVGQARGVPGRAGAAQRRQAALAPLGVPAADVLAGDAELVGDLGLGVAGGKQPAGLHADVFERLAVAQTAGVAAVGGWSHTAILPAKPRSCHPKGRTSLISGFGVRVPGGAPYLTCVVSAPWSSSASNGRPHAGQMLGTAFGGFGCGPPRPRSCSPPAGPSCRSGGSRCRR